MSYQNVVIMPTATKLQVLDSKERSVRTVVHIVRKECLTLRGNSFPISVNIMNAKTMHALDLEEKSVHTVEHIVWKEWLM